MESASRHARCVPPRQRIPNRRRDGGEKGVHGRLRDRRRITAHSAGEGDSGADRSRVIIGGGQDGRLHVCIEGIPRRRFNNPVGIVRRIAQEMCDRRPRRIHTGCRRQARQVGEMIPSGTLDERREDVGMESAGDG